MIGPGDFVAREFPDKGGLAETGKDGRGLRRGGCQSRLVSGRAEVILKENDNASLAADPRQNSLNNSKNRLRPLREPDPANRTGRGMRLAMT